MIQKHNTSPYRSLTGPVGEDRNAPLGKAVRRHELQLAEALGAVDAGEDCEIVGRDLGVAIEVALVPTKHAVCTT